MTLLSETILENIRNFLAALAPRLAAGNWLCVGSGEDEAILTLLVRHLEEAGARPENLMKCAGSEASPANRAALILLGPSLPIDSACLWLSHMPALGEPILVGCGELPQGNAEPLLAARPDGTRLTFSGGFWYATRGATLLPDNYHLNMVGVFSPIHLTCAEEGLTTLTDRDDFLNLSGRDIACRYHEGGGETFLNPLPETTAAANLTFFGGYRESDVSEGASLQFLRNVTMSGRIGILYDRDNGAIEESFTYGKRFAPTLRGLVQHHDYFIKTCQLSLEGNSIPHLGAYRATTTIQIDQPVVTTYAWDLWSYNHWMHDTLSRFWYLDRFPELRRLPVVIGQLSRRFHHEYLALLGLSDLTFVEHHPGATLKLSRAYLSSLADPPLHAPGALDWLRNKLLPRAAALPAGYEKGLYYISRGDATRRRVVDEERIQALVEKAGFKVVEFSQFTIAEQIALMRNAKAVIGPHGSSLANLVFAGPGCALLDLLPTRESLEPRIEGALGPEFLFNITRRGGSHFPLLAKGQSRSGDMESDYFYDFGEFESVFDQLMAKIGR